ncbi:MAG TPA: hypothetical protein ENK52_03440 [Saprospiraceae bacterium]|nr:hypothetical protein [Saprospiraceae bacterium]
MKIIFALITVLLISNCGPKMTTVVVNNQTNDNLKVIMFSEYYFPIAPIEYMESDPLFNTDSIFMSVQLFDPIQIGFLKYDTINFFSEIRALDSQGGSVISVYDEKKQVYHTTFLLSPQQRYAIYRIYDHILLNFKGHGIPLKGLHIYRMDTDTLVLELNSAKDIYKEFHLGTEKKEIEITIGNLKKKNKR